MLGADEFAAHAERVKVEGFSIIPDAIDESLLNAIEVDLNTIESTEKTPPGDNLFEGFKTVRIYNLLARSEVYRAIPVHENVLPVVERVLDRGCLVSSISSIAIDPGEVAQPLHADDQLIPLPRPHVPIVCNTIWAITDFTATNGGTRVVPGSHKRDRSPQLGEDVITTPVEMRRGSVLVYDGSLWHGGGPNDSSARRLGIAMNYCAGWVRQQENQLLGIPLATARAFSPRLRKLCGFGLYRSLLGHIDRCSPVDLLDQTGPRRAVGLPSRD
jgi:ectoine hydroxylase-related dioxygenase (phytanoyl-CoA dioxygenase family)